MPSIRKHSSNAFRAFTAALISVCIIPALGGCGGDDEKKPADEADATNRSGDDGAGETDAAAANDASSSDTGTAKSTYYPESSTDPCEKATDCDPAGTLCYRNECVKKRCLSVHAKDGIACDDFPCKNAACTAGVCKASKKQDLAHVGKKCDDGNACTKDDTCNPAFDGADFTTCSGTPEIDAPCDDGKPCTKTGTCDDKGACKPGPIDTSIKCDDANPCTKDDACHKTAGCTGTPEVGKGCSDGDPCTIKEACSASGSCSGGQPKCKDDGNPCTTTCSKSGDCNPAKKVGTECDDGDPCTIKEACSASGSCSGGQPKCKDDGNPCTTTCSKSGDCNPAKKVGTECDDGESCTLASACDKDAVCGGGEFICGCLPPDMKAKAAFKHITGDTLKKVTCAKWAYASDKCYGTQFCDTSAKVWTCKTTPGTNFYAKPCPKAAGGCMVAKCDPTTGKCASSPAKMLTICDDGDPCTVNEICDGKGACKSTTSICSCTPANAAEKCKHLVGSKCDGTVYCDTSKGAWNHQCKIAPGTKVDCAKDSEPCKKLACDKATGKCVNSTKDGALCDDGDKCTANESCFKGTCGAPDPVKQAANKSDGDPKNDNDPTGGQGITTCACQKDADCPQGAPCDGTKYCDPTTKKCLLKPFSAPVCPTAKDTECIKHLCDPATGKCVATPAENVLVYKLKDGGDTKLIKRPMPYAVKTVGCDDGQICTVNAVCKSGTCMLGTTNVCKACKKHTDCKKYATKCTGAAFCDFSGAYGFCRFDPAKHVKCKGISSDGCSIDACDPATGKCVTKANADGGACADGDPCTWGDTCAGTTCKPGQNFCNCKSDADCVLPGVTDACEPKLKCDKAAKVPQCIVDVATIVTCPEAPSSCLSSGCNSVTGKCQVKTRADGSWCVDDDVCTINSTCKGGACQGGKPAPSCGCQADADCAAQNKCFAMTCTKKAGKGVCTPGKPIVTCAKPSGCVAEYCSPKTGKCIKGSPTSACVDGNHCTLDSCDTKTGKCSNKPAPDGSWGGPSMTCVGGKAVSLKEGQALVKPGKVSIGCNAAAQTCSAMQEKPQHAADLSAFLIDRFEVSVKRYSACVKAGKCKAAGKTKGCTAAIKAPTSDPLPINCVTFAQAKAFCTYAGGRLPTEAEWEKAARGGCETTKGDCAKSARTYPWGTQPAATCSLAVVGAKSQPCTPSAAAQIGSKYTSDRSAYGLFDMAGNVAEWTSDAYDAGWYSKAGATKKDPKNPQTGQSLVAVRGGDFESPASSARVAQRRGVKPAVAQPSIGFRCVTPIK